MAVIGSSNKRLQGTRRKRLAPEAPRLGHVARVLMKPTSESWSAEPEGSSLSIRGSATFPNDFSTASLRRQQYTLRDGDTLTFMLSFHRDKEPVYGPDLVGPVHHFERHIPATVSRVRIISESGEQFEFPIGKRGRR